MDMTTILLQFLVPFCFLPCMCWGVEVTQEKMMVVSAGNEVVILCKHNDNTYLTMLWYQQKKGQGLTLLTYSVGKDSNDIEDKDNINKWATERPEILKYYLKITNPEVGDSAVYFCAASTGSNTAAKLDFGEGTILSVLENGEEQRPPNVKIFGPSKQEFKDHNLISLVCVASGFYPEHVQLNWTINGIPRNGLYQNVATKKENDTSFSTSKRLTLTRSEYFNTENTFRCEAGFIGNDSDAFDEVKGKQDCGVSKESYAMYINQGKISYIMVLFKSGLYALIVLAIIWRRKVLSGSC